MEQSWHWGWTPRLRLWCLDWGWVHCWGLAERALALPLEPLSPAKGLGFSLGLGVGRKVRQPWYLHCTRRMMVWG